MDSLDAWQRETDLSTKRSQERRAKPRRQFPISLREILGILLLLFLAAVAVFGLVLVV